MVFKLLQRIRRANWPYPKGRPNRCNLLRQRHQPCQNTLFTLFLAYFCGL